MNEFLNSILVLLAFTLAEWLGMWWADREPKNRTLKKSK